MFIRHVGWWAWKKTGHTGLPGAAFSLQESWDWSVTSLVLVYMISIAEYVYGFIIVLLHSNSSADILSIGRVFIVLL